ncbi:EB module family protein, partial [Aphelenchoides avenae]
MIQLYNGVVCQNDQTCQMQSNGFFCYQGYCCANSVTLPGGYGSTCTYDSQCNFINSQCTNNFCNCQYGYNFDGQNCGFNNLPGGGSGPCSSGQVSIQGLCYNRVGYRGFCSFSQQCSYANGVCVQGRCVCQTGQIYDGTECVNDPDLPAASNCNSNEVYINGACYGTSLPGQACIYDQQCIGGADQRCFTGLCTDCSNGQCDSATTCTGNQVLINGRCYPLVGPGQACTYTQQCTSLYQDRGMLCQNGVCQFNDRGNPLIPRTGN